MHQRGQIPALQRRVICKQVHILVQLGGVARHNACQPRAAIELGQGPEVRVDKVRQLLPNLVDFAAAAVAAAGIGVGFNLVFVANMLVNVGNSLQ